jgi:hypothetical protein
MPFSPCPFFLLHPCCHQVFKRNKISVDVVATSEVSVSLTLDSKKLNPGDTDMMALKADLDQVAQVGCSTRTIDYEIR